MVYAADLDDYKMTVIGRVRNPFGYMQLFRKIKHGVCLENAFCKICVTICGNDFSDVLQEIGRKENHSLPSKEDNWMI